MLILALVYITRSARASADIRPRENVVGSIYLEEPFIVYFQPKDGNPNAESASMALQLKEYVDKFKIIVESGLGGEIVQEFDTVLHGFVASLDYNEKIMRVLGSPTIPQDARKDTKEKLYAFLSNLNAADLQHDGVEMKLEYDQTVDVSQ